VIPGFPYQYNRFATSLAYRLDLHYWPWPNSRHTHACLLIPPLTIRPYQSDSFGNAMIVHLLTSDEPPPSKRGSGAGGVTAIQERP
jgi:hypothetical protein